MNQETSDIIRKLSQQVNVNAIETKDLVKELETLYKTVGSLESMINNLNEQVETSRKLHGEDEAKLTSYQNEYVTPAREFSKMSAELERSKWEFELEKKWIKTDRDNMLEIVKMLTSRFTSSQNHNEPNGGSYYESHSWEKPQLK